MIFQKLSDINLKEIGIETKTFSPESDPWLDHDKVQLLKKKNIIDKNCYALTV